MFRNFFKRGSLSFTIFFVLVLLAIRSKDLYYAIAGTTTEAQILRGTDPHPNATTKHTISYSFTDGQTHRIEYAPASTISPNPHFPAATVKIQYIPGRLGLSRIYTEDYLLDALWPPLFLAAIGLTAFFFQKRREKVVPQPQLN